MCIAITIISTVGTGVFMLLSVPFVMVARAVLGGVRDVVMGSLSYGLWFALFTLANA